MKKCHVPIRQCVGCKARKAKAGFLRFVSPTSGAWHADPDSRLPGRGVYLCSPACVERLKKNKRYRTLVSVAQTTAASEWPTTQASPAA